MLLPRDDREINQRLLLSSDALMVFAPFSLRHFFFLLLLTPFFSGGLISRITQLFVGFNAFFLLPPSL